MRLHVIPCRSPRLQDAPTPSTPIAASPVSQTHASEPSANQLRALLILDRLTNSPVSSNAPPIVQTEVVLFTVNVASGCKAMPAHQLAQPLRIEAEAFGELSAVHRNIISSKLSPFVQVALP